MRGVVWIPGWDILVALREGAAVDEPIAVYGQRVIEVNAPARARGVSVGMRKRAAQATCPELRLVKHNQAGSLKLFEQVLAACEKHVAYLSILKPGLVTFLARGPIRQAGSADALAEAILGQIAEDTGYEAHIGFAPGLLAAILASYRDLQIEDPERFLDSQPIETLEEACFSPPLRQEMKAFISTMSSMGIHRIGDLRRLEAQTVLSRFGRIGQISLRLISGQEVAEYPAISQETCSVERSFDEPLTSVDQVSFLSRELAEELNAKLTRQGMMAREFRIEARSATGKKGRRAWTVEHAGAREIADRVRWQVASWVRAAQLDVDDDSFGAGLISLSIEADGLYPAGLAQGLLWGGDYVGRHVATRGISRIQSLLGQDAVVVPEKVGGRHPYEKYVLRPWDAPESSTEHADAPWPGAIPEPWPATVYTKTPTIRLFDEGGHECLVSTLGVFYCAEDCADPRPAVLIDDAGRAVVTEYAGPWLQASGWWNPRTQERKAWCQIRTGDGEGLLVLREAGEWKMSGRYA